jgi:tetraacyldisaccharide 4'-kinase
LLLVTTSNPMTPSGPARAVSPFVDLVSGRRRGLLAALLRLGLLPASWFYGLAVRLRNAAYTSGWVRSTRADAAVFSVGNLTAGGTGKTPFVEYLAGFLRERGWLVAVLSRGYGGDEALLLEENLPDVPHLQGPDRAALAAVAVEELESEVLVLDDGFQHRRLARDLDVVLLDATCPWGFGHLLPRGLLREPASGLRRADAVVLTRCDQATPADLEALRRRVAKLAQGVVVAETVHEPLALLQGSDASTSSQALRGQAVAAVCGIGNPEAFRRTLAGLGANLVDFRVYPDHHAYTRPDVEELRDWARSLPEDSVVVTTQKDMVKLRLAELGGRPLFALRVGMAFRSGQNELEELLDGVLRRREEVKEGPSCQG